VAVVDSNRTLGRNRDLRQRGLIAQADEDTAQAAYDSAVAQFEASGAQEQSQTSAVRAAEAQLRVTEAMLKNAMATVAQNEAAQRQAQVDLDHTYIRAPVDGTVVGRTVDVGQTVAASLQAPTLFTIAQDLRNMQVDTNVDEADVGRVKVGQTTTFTVDSFPGRTFNGEVVQIRKAPLVVQNVVTYDVVVTAKNPDQRLLPGMTANVRIVIDQKESVLQVPNAALRFRPAGVEAPERERTGRPAGGGRGGGPPSGRVYVLGPDGKPAPLSLQLGIGDGTFTEVVRGDVKEGQMVIVGAALPGDRAPSQTGTAPRLRL
jgi:HlyD family secretion protein